MKIKDVKARVAADLEAAGWQMTEGAIAAIVEATVTQLGLAVDTKGEIYNPAESAMTIVPTEQRGVRWIGSGRGGRSRR